MMIVGLHGKIEHGKDQVAAQLVSAHGFARLGMADELKHELRARLRRTVKAITIRDEVTGEMKALPDHLRWHADVDRDESWWDERLHYALWVERSPTIRALEQEYGTDVRRTDDYDYWVKRWEWRLLSMKAPRVVVPDIRFENEAQYIRKHGGWLLRVVRPGHETAAHSARDHVSEHGLDNWTDWDGVFTNNGTLDDLRYNVDAWYVWALHRPPKPT